MRSLEGSLVVAAARAWIGTPYCHQSSVKGAGTDCLGLIRGIWRELLGAEPEVMPRYTRDWSEPQAEEVLLRGAIRHLQAKELSASAAGDILVFRMRDRGVAKHLGIAAEIGSNASFIHAYSGHGVVESPLSLPWQRRIAARFTLPKGEF